MYYDRKGQPMTRLDWATAFEQERNVGQTEIGNQRVSTVWLGLNHSIFETMIFGGPHDQYQERYSTEEEALRGHLRIVARLQAGEAP